MDVCRFIIRYLLLRFTCRKGKGFFRIYKQIEEKSDKKVIIRKTNQRSSVILSARHLPTRR